MGHLQVGGFDLLRVIGGQAGKDQNAQDRDRKGHGRRGQEDVHDRRHDQTDHTHDQEGAHGRKVFFRGVAIQ